MVETVLVERAQWMMVVDVDRVSLVETLLLVLVLEFADISIDGSTPAAYW